MTNRIAASLAAYIIASAICMQAQPTTTLQALHTQNPSAPKDFSGPITTIANQTAHNGLPSVQNIAVSSENVHSLITYPGSTASTPLALVHVVGWFCPDKTSPTDYSCDS